MSARVGGRWVNSRSGSATRRLLLDAAKGVGCIEYRPKLQTYDVIANRAVAMYPGWSVQILRTPDLFTAIGHLLDHARRVRNVDEA